MDKSLLSCFLTRGVYVDLFLTLYVFCCSVGVTNVDSGNYTCEIRTPDANILGGVTHSIFVRGKWQCRA